MKNRIFLSTLAAVLLLGGCSRDIEDAGGVKTSAEAGHIITVKTWLDKQTKAAPMTADNFTSFTLSAWETGKTAAADALLDAVTVVRSEKGVNGADTWSYKPEVSWPGTNTVNFYAYSPAQSPYLTSGLGDATTEPSIEYALPGLITVPGTPPAKSVRYQEDLLVSKQSGNYTSDGQDGITLRFRHALSRVVVKAKNLSASKRYAITKVTLKNIIGTGKLDLSLLPDNSGSFVYPTDEATLTSLGYQTLWDVSGGAKGDLEADLPASGVLINYSPTTYQSVTDGQNGLYVIPQKPEFNTDLPVGTEGGTSPSGLFYLEVEYKDVVDGQPLSGSVTHTYAFPVRAQVGNDKSASSIAFEMQRQYTFLLGFGDGEQSLEFGGVSVENFDESNDIDAIKLPNDTTILLWAGSNIYYDGTNLTFDADSIHINEKYQGVFFKWGSLVGMGIDGVNGDPWANGSAVTYPYAGGPVVNTDIANIPLIVPTVPVSNDPDGKYLLEHHDSLNFKGDICLYLTEKGYAPAGNWRMPTSNELAKQVLANSWVGTIGGSVGDDTGTIEFGFGVNAGNVYFPMSGNISLGYTVHNQGNMGFYWSSSVYAANYSRAMVFNGNTSVTGVESTLFEAGLSVRCVREQRLPLPLN
ncbi:hypothetical protein AGMMS49574_07190 [Bacteroidia bacterium]|nr:hypothetical protein AGMMS49574_07190 [Bacteroidia bacterium]